MPSAICTFPEKLIEMTPLGLRLPIGRLSVVRSVPRQGAIRQEGAKTGKYSQNTLYKAYCRKD
jgi:hypothetical protein